LTRRFSRFRLFYIFVVPVFVLNEKHVSFFQTVKAAEKAARLWECGLQNCAVHSRLLSEPYSGVLRSWPHVWQLEKLSREEEGCTKLLEKLL
jgi:hypothetical protein